MIIQIHDGLKETWTDVKGIKLLGYIPVTTVPFESLYWRNMELLSKIFPYHVLETEIERYQFSSKSVYLGSMIEEKGREGVWTDTNVYLGSRMEEKSRGGVWTNTNVYLGSRIEEKGREGVWTDTNVYL